MRKHYLYYVDTEYKTAFCSVCGPTDIHLVQSGNGAKPKAICLNRLNESREKAKELKIQKRKTDPNWKPRHALTAIDTASMTAVCAVCGPTDILKHSRSGAVSYLCATRERPYNRSFQRSRYTPRKYGHSVHSLTEIDEDKKTAVCSICGPVEIYVWQGNRKIGRRCSNASVYRVKPAQEIRREINIGLIREFKTKRGCQNCGFRGEAHELYLIEPNSTTMTLRTDRLLTLNRKDLFQDLEKYTVRCENCLTV